MRRWQRSKSAARFSGNKEWKMFVRILGNWGRFRDGEVREVHERVGALWAARGGAEEVPYKVYRDYRRTIDPQVAEAFDAREKAEITRAVIDEKAGAHRAARRGTRQVGPLARR
jgi:hypothetical protein